MANMQAMVLEKPRTPLVPVERPLPVPAPRRTADRGRGLRCLPHRSARGGRRTAAHPKLPIVPGHEIVGRVAAIGRASAAFRVGERVGVPWLGHTCGVCPYCRAGRENLCDAPLFTGYTRDGGYATHAVADARLLFSAGEDGDDAALRAVLCAGLIGWRCYRMAGRGGDARPLRLRRRRAHSGAGGELAGAARVCFHARAATRPRRTSPARSARTGPAAPTIAARAARCRHHLRAGRRAGAGGAQGRAERRPRGLRRHPYVGHSELSLRAAVGRAAGDSVANLTRNDAREFLALAPRAGVTCEVTRYPLTRANEALSDLREGRLQGAAVLVP